LAIVIALSALSSLRGREDLPAFYRIDLYGLSLVVIFHFCWPNFFAFQNGFVEFLQDLQRRTGSEGENVCQARHSGR
jgi:hypothetical protein